MIGQGWWYRIRREKQQMLTRLERRRVLKFVFVIVVIGLSLCVLLWKL